MFKRVSVVLIISIKVFFNSAARAFELPQWVMKVTAEKQEAEVDNPPGYIEKCSYQGRDVFYVSTGCCDQYSYVYDADQVQVCAPDGGMTGQGDGKCPDYYDAKKDCVMIWKDTRTWPPGQ